MGDARRRAPLTIALSLAMAAVAHAQNQEECLATWDKATAGGLVYGVGIIEGGIGFVVDERTWISMDYSTKQQMAAVFECAMTTPGEALAGFTIYSNLTNRVVGRVRWGKLAVE